MENRITFFIDEKNIAWLTLNRPDIHNALDGKSIEELILRLNELHRTPSVRALVLQGNGKSFCSGADLSWIQKITSASEIDHLREAHQLSDVMHLLDTLPCPTLCAVQGAIMGGGIGLMACSDIVIADPNSKFCFSEIKVGLIPAVVSPYVLRAIGPRFTRRYFLTSETFSALEAHRIGLVHEVSKQENHSKMIDELLKHIALGAPKAIQQAKQLIQDLCTDMSEDIRHNTAKWFADLRLSEEGQKGIQAFLERKLPPWIEDPTSND